MKKSAILFLAILLVISLTACKSDDYKEAMELYANREYDAALVLFTELGDYEDSINMVIKCRYAQAHLLMNDGKYDDARAIFEELGDYEDSAVNVQECYYLKAIALMEEKAYEAAEQIFVMLGDYKDSVNYAEGMGWYLFLNYVSEQGEIVTENLLYNHTGVISVDAGKLCAEISNVGNSALISSGMTAKVIIDHDSSKSDLWATANIAIGQYVIDDKAFTKWDIGSYKTGDFIDWDDYDHYFSWTDAFGKAASTDIGNTLTGETSANLIAALIDCIQKGIEISELNVTLADLGFRSIDN